VSRDQQSSAIESEAAADRPRRGPPSRRLASAFWIGLPAVLAGGIWMICHAASWHGFSGGDVFEYASIARNMASGRGYTANSLWLNDLPVGSPPYAYPLHRSPLACAYLVPGVALAGDTAWSILAPTLLLYMGLAVWVKWLGGRLAGRLAGICALALFLTNYNVLAFALSGLPTLLFGAIVTGLLVLLGAEPLSARRAALAGVLAGIGYLTRPNMLFVAAGVMAVLLVRRRPGFRAIAACLVATLVTVSPYLVANYRHTGSLLGNSRKYVTLFETDAFPGSTIHETLAPPEPLAFYREHPDQFARKVARQAAELPRTWWTAFRLAVLVFAVVGACVPGGDPRESRLRDLLLGAAAGQAACDLLTVSISRFWIPLVPVACALAGAGLARSLDRLWAWRRWTAVLLAAGVLGVAVRPWWHLSPVLRDNYGPRPDRQIALAVAELSADREQLVAAFNSAAIAWFGDRRTINLPGDPGELLAVDERVGRIACVVAGGPGHPEWLRRFEAHPELSRRFHPVRTVEWEGRVVARIFGRSDRLVLGTHDRHMRAARGVGDHRDDMDVPR
jgi:4-amino-4-deoxy-L-arabinose transferase-like glycosyltransferase